MSEDGLRAAEEKMRADGVADAAVSTFAHYYRQLEEGETGMLPEDAIDPVTDLPAAHSLPKPPDGGREALGRAVVIKLNGGLGTSMGMTRAKSLLEVKDGHTFLDVIVNQVLELRKRFGVALPLVLMDSFATRDDTLAALERYDDLAGDVPLDFLQNKEPKLRADDLAPVDWPDDPALEWCPPGHGDLYTALVTSGMLEQLLDAGHTYAFVSNSDNLGAILDPRILAWFATEGAPFLMEVVPRSPADRKGGHLARRKEDGGLVLRETAQTPEDDLEALQDTSRHRWANTNNLWVNLERLDAVMRERDGVLGLPMIVNHKTVDPGDKSSPEVVQIETAMGAAVSVFEGAQAVEVSRHRFAPVKTTNDLLVVRSDFYELRDDFRLEPAGDRDPGGIFVDLDSDYYKLVGDFDERFPHGAPSLRDCERLVVSGDVTFGAHVVVRGDAEVSGPREVEDGAVLSG